LLLLAVYCGAILVASFAGGLLPQYFAPSHRAMQTAISLIAGLMLGIGVFHLLPHALVELGPHGPDLMAGGLMAGLVLMFLLLRLFHFHQHGPVAPPSPTAECGHDHDHAHGHDHHHAQSHSLSWVGVFVGMGLHTIIDGLVLGASVEVDAQHQAGFLFGLGTFLAVVLHKPLDSIAITSLMKVAGWSRRSQILVNLVFALMCPAGAGLFVLGVHELSGDQSQVLGIALAVSAGVFICIALSDLLPEIEFHSHDRVRLTAALLVGIALAWGIRFLEPEHAHHHDSAAPGHADSRPRRAETALVYGIVRTSAGAEIRYSAVERGDPVDGSVRNELRACIALPIASEEGSDSRGVATALSDADEFPTACVTATGSGLEVPWGG
jgi:zinc and cadmium transporter